MRTDNKNKGTLLVGIIAAGLLSLLPGTLPAQEKAPATLPAGGSGSVTTPASLTSTPESGTNGATPVAEAAKTDKGKASAGSPSVPMKARPFLSSLSFGGDVYFGGTNVTGIRARNNDGVWAGFGPVYPSNLSLNWKQGDTRAFRVPIGIGDLYTAAGTTLRQPVEAYYQVPAGKGCLTIGKHYVPFATQEWEYETKYGLMYTMGNGPMTYVTSINYNFNRRAPNLYLRAGRRVSKRTSLGLSLGGGRGVFTGTSHGAALGLDLSHDMGGVLLTSEYNLAIGPRGPFHFLYGKATFTKLGNFSPYVGAYYWQDQAQELGNFSSLLAGMSYKLTRTLALEAGYARGEKRDIMWFQSHTTF